MAESKDRDSERPEVSVVRGSLSSPQEGSLRALATALMELAVQVLREKEQVGEVGEVEEAA